MPGGSLSLLPGELNKENEMTMLSDMIDDVLDDTDLNGLVSINRGDDSCNIYAVKMPPKAALSQLSNEYVNVNDVDWLIRATDYAPVGSAESIPQRGDTITDAVGNIYEVLDRESVGAFEWHDPEHYALRVHTILKTLA